MGHVQVLHWMDCIGSFKECAHVVSAESVLMALSLFAAPEDAAAAGEAQVPPPLVPVAGSGEAIDAAGAFAAAQAQAASIALHYAAAASSGMVPDAAEVAQHVQAAVPPPAVSAVATALSAGANGAGRPAVSGEGDAC